MYEECAHAGKYGDIGGFAACALRHSAFPSGDLRQCAPAASDLGVCSCGGAALLPWLISAMVHRCHGSSMRWPIDALCFGLVGVSDFKTALYDTEKRQYVVVALSELIVPRYDECCCKW